MNFLDLPSCNPAEADALILPVPMELTVSYGGGTAGGPEAVLDASRQIETFDEQTGVDFERDLRIATLPAFQGPDDPAAYIERLAEHVRGAVSGQGTTGGLPSSAGPHPSPLTEGERTGLLVAIGGEHLLTLGTVGGLCDDLSRLTIVQLDAHADLADRLDGRRLSHGTVMRRLWEQGARLVQIGVRSLSRAEFELSRDDPRIATFFGHDLDQRWPDMLALLAGLAGDVYLSIDVDSLDPSVIPSTGTPQPGGLSWSQTMAVLAALARADCARLIGADIVEFVPSPHPPGCDLTAAKLVAKLLALLAP